MRSGRRDRLREDREGLGDSTAVVVSFKRAPHRPGGDRRRKWRRAAKAKATRFAGRDLACINVISAAGLTPHISDADNVRVDPKTGQVVVGYGSGALAIIDPARRSVVRTIAVGAHPEGFQIDGQGRKAFVNVPDAHKIVVVDLESGRALANWRAAHVANFPITLGEASEIVGVVYRIPARLVLLEAASGTAKADLPTCDDADDLYFDDKRRRVYVSCGSGAVDVFEQHAGGKYVASAHIETRPGARTSLFVPALDRLFVASRARSGGRDAALLVYRPAP